MLERQKLKKSKTNHSTEAVIEHCTLLTASDAASYLGLTISTLQRQRSDGTGPRFVKLGKRRIAYRIEDINSWVASNVTTSTAAARQTNLST